MNYPDADDLYQGKFTDGIPLGGIEASVASAEHMNAIYDELTTVIKAGQVTPSSSDLSQLAQSIGRQLRSQAKFDSVLKLSSGTTEDQYDLLEITSADYLPKVTQLFDYDEFKFIVQQVETDSEDEININTAAKVMLKIDDLAALEITNINGEAQLFKTAMVTVMYLDGAFILKEQINPKTGNAILDIGKLYTDTMDIVRSGECVFNGDPLDRTECLILWETAKATGKVVSQTVKDADPITYGGFYGDGDGTASFTLPDLRGEFIRMFDDERDLDTDRIFGSRQKGSVVSHNEEWSGIIHGIETNFTGQANSKVYLDSLGLDRGDSLDYPSVRAVAIGAADENGDFLTNLGWGGGVSRPHNIAYYGKTRF